MACSGLQCVRGPLVGVMGSLKVAAESVDDYVLILSSGYHGVRTIEHLSIFWDGPVDWNVELHGSRVGSR